MSADPAPAPAPASPLLSLPRAVGGNGIDAPVAAHYGSFTTEQRTLAAGEGFVDLSHRGVVRISGPERLSWLHALTSQHLATLPAGTPTAALLLSPTGHVEHALYGVDDGEAFTAHVEPGRAPALVGWLEKMKFLTRVEVEDLTSALAVTWRPARLDPATPYSGYDLVPRAELEKYAAAAGPACGHWAYEALRIERGEPRLGLDTDERTIPNEAGWIGSAVHLDKGCYRGQETVARVHTLGRPPRRLTLLHLDGSDPTLPPLHAELRPAGADPASRPVGFVGTSARHHELGPIALAMVKRNVATDTELDITTPQGALPAMQQVLVDPEIGLHVRPDLR